MGRHKAEELQSGAAPLSAGMAAFRHGFDLAFSSLERPNKQPFPHITPNEVEHEGSREGMTLICITVNAGRDS